MTTRHKNVMTPTVTSQQILPTQRFLEIHYQRHNNIIKVSLRAANTDHPNQVECDTYRYLEAEEDKVHGFNQLHIIITRVL